MNCLNRYLNNKDCQSDKPAIIFYKGLSSLDKATSFKDLHNNSIKAQKHLLSKGYKTGDILLLFEQPSANLYAYILGALGLGIKLMIIEPWMKANNINALMRRTPPKGVITGTLGKLVLLKSKEFRSIKHKFSSSSLESIKLNKNDSLEVLDVEEDFHAILTFTTGTTGEPKGVHRKHQYLVDQAEILSKYVSYDKANKLDLTVFTNVVLLNITLGKGSMIIPSSWDKKILKSLDKLPEEFKVDTSACGPNFLERLIKNTHNIDLDFLFVGGALGDNKLYKKALNKWPNTKMTLLYGSTEAEPVSMIDLDTAVKLSEKNNYFQTLYLGEPIKEITLKTKEEILWVSGMHVSPMYENDPIANKKNKELIDGVTWHNMGDKIHTTAEGLLYQGRDFQSGEEFQTEQGVYNITQSSHSFIKNEEGVLTLYGESVLEHKEEIQNKFPSIKNIINRKIIRDPRHRARIDREQSIERGVYMKDIIKFINERTPLVPNIILAIGLLMSTQFLIEKQASLVGQIFICVSFIIFIMELRFMDEYKDYEKDKIAHPDRPLPRGLISVTTVKKLISSFFAALVLISILSFTIFNPIAGGMFLLATLWLFLMYKEFFIPNLAKFPFIYAISHQIIIIPAALFMIALISPEDAFSSRAIYFSILILSTFFSFEVGRKMNPEADPILGTYLVHYKKLKTHIAINLLLIMGVIAGIALDKCLWVLIPYILLTLGQLYIYKNENKYKVFEGIITLNIIYGLWLIPLSELVK